jgi:hypothetical protein
VEVDREAFQSLEDLQHFVDTRANALKLTAPRPVKVVDPADLLQRLFEELVGGRARRKPATAFPPELAQTFRRLKQEGRAELNLRVEIPILRRELRVPYAYRNGVWNLVRPKVFSSDEGAAIAQAQQLAVDGDLLQRKDACADGERRLVVLTAFEPTRDMNDLESRITGLFDAYDVRSVRQRDVRDFMAEVESQAH